MHINVYFRVASTRTINISVIKTQNKKKLECVSLTVTLDIAEQYILKNIHWANEITGMERTDIPEIPVAVIREALANSFAHLIYNGSTYHEICTYPSKVTIYSPGPYESSHKPEDYIKKNLQSSIPCFE